ncbi:hypothetical protein MP33_16215 [Escherichia coli N37058PS]|nr:hypothetical protein MP33_16215 [Escherichia coli N37058PS]
MRGSYLWFLLGILFHKHNRSIYVFLLLLIIRQMFKKIPVTMFIFTVSHNLSFLSKTI